LLLHSLSSLWAREVRDGGCDLGCLLKKVTQLVGGMVEIMRKCRNIHDNDFEVSILMERDFDIVEVSLPSDLQGVLTHEIIYIHGSNA
jgi:hypothetical protein